MARADRIQERTLSHTGAELGEDRVTLSQNQTEPQRESAIVAFNCPRKFEGLSYNGRRHWTKLELRTVEEFDGTGTEFTTEANLSPIAGEEDLDDQPFPAVVAADTGDGSEIEVVNVNYATNTVELAEEPAGDLKLYPVITEGGVQYQGVNQFGQVEGPVDKWKMPVYRWADFDQDKRGTEVNLQGSAAWSEDEELRLVLDSPHAVVWEDEHYPLGSYVSHIEQKVDVEL